MKRQTMRNRLVWVMALLWGPAWSGAVAAAADEAAAPLDVRVTVTLDEGQLRAVEGRMAERVGALEGRVASLERSRPVEPAPPAAAAPATPADEGWTVFTPHADTRMVFVSAEGDDANDGLTPATAVRTPDRGYALIRNGWPDWLLFRRGDAFDLSGEREGPFREWRKSGAAGDQMLLVSAYGDPALPRPVLRSNGLGGIDANGGQAVKHVAFTDLHFYANRRDPATGAPGADTGEAGFVWNQQGSENILLEGCLFEYFSCHLEAQNPYKKDRGVDGLTVRRCVLRSAYATSGFAQGGYFQNLTRLTIEDCVIDHNGWEPRVKKAGRIGFNHGFYVNHGSDIRIRGNLFARSSYGAIKLRGDAAGDLKRVTIEGNVFADEIVGVNAGGQDDDESLVIEDLAIRGNVFWRMGGTLSNGVVDASAVELSQVRGAAIAGNLILDAGARDHLAPLKSGLDRHPIAGVEIAGNAIVRWPLSDKGKYIWIRHDAALRDNRVEDESGGPSLATYARSLGLADEAGLYEATAAQRKGRWDPRLTAAAIRAALMPAYGL